MRRRPWARRSLVLGLGAVVVVVLGVASTRLGGLDDPALARRVLLWRGVLCTPKIVEREGEALRVVCADGKHRLRRRSASDEGWACVLGLEVACWERAPEP